MTSVVDRMIRDFGIGYFKLDYNNSAWGTDLDACSAGQGLLEHNRAVVAWLKDIRDRHPELVIENCASGGCRMDYAMLAQAQIQSSSDQEDCRKYPAILVGELAAVLPEQLGVWSYPLAADGAREAAFNMVNGMAGRIQLSGGLDKLSPEAMGQVESGIQVYKASLAPMIPRSIPFFPLGMPSLADSRSPVAVGLRSDGKEFLYVWRLEGAPIVTVPVGVAGARLIYPAGLGIEAHAAQGRLSVTFPAPYMGAIFEVDRADIGVPSTGAGRLPGTSAQ
jgi:alpha-galactosidase